ncbi:MAG: flagellar protein FlgN [Hydrogenovibrio sp.]|uniref:flagella synthesis protein FlgN n=1 Tax=Hydrogenovibrio sp. TaxID=2065821 RepID=UPI00286FFBA8|nr:flagellar protein FlgN [Hydrogenovibrio sp.]MDR9499341.1 flagellar protein FlgN [Hydrogenovibrio sp.]
MQQQAHQFSAQDKQTLTDSLTALTAQLGAFYALLQQEADQLKSDDPEALEKLSAKKADTLTALEQAHQTLTNLLTPDQDSSLQTLIESPVFTQLPKPLQNQLIKADQLAQKCYQLNLSNGMTIQALNNLNTGLISALVGQPGTSQTYDPKGKKSAYSQGNNSLGKA